MTPAASGAVEVFVFQAGRFLGSRCFTQSTIVIGSGPDATLRLRDPAIAARHAVLRVKGDSLVLASNGDAGGGQVLINGEPVSVRRVHSFDEIRIGPFRLKLTLLGGKPAEDPGFGLTAPAPSQPESIAHDAPAAAPSQRRAEAPPRRTSANAHDSAAAWVEEEEAEDAPTRQHVPGWDDPDSARADAEFDDDSVTSMRPRPDEAARNRAPSHRFDAASALSRSRPSDASAPAQRGTAPHRALADDFDRGPAARMAEAEEAATAADGAPAQTPWSADSAAPYGDEAEAAAAAAPRFDPATHFADEDDEDDEEPFVESFSLLENVVRERFKTPTDTEHCAIIEVIRYRDGEILDLMRADPGQNVRLAPDNFRLLRVSGDGSAVLYFRPDMDGSIVRGGKARSLKRLARPDTLVNPTKQLHGVQLREGDYAQIVRNEGGYLARFVRPPTVPKAKTAVRLDLGKVQVFAGSAAFHFLILVLLGFVAPEADLNVETETERFAKVSVKDLKLEKPQEEPKQEEPPPEPEAPPKEAPKPKTTKKTRRAPSPTRQAQARQKQQKKQVANVLSALQNIAPTGAPGRSNLKSLITNVKAVRAPTGAGSGFKIAGTIGKLPGKGIRLAGMGGGGKDTRVGSKLLAGGKIGGMKAIAGTGTRVRGRAGKAPTRAIRRTGGILSRAAIQKVVSQHMNKIQACYERQLLVNRGLAGKIVFDWVISPSGSVSSARQARSTLASAAVSSCILSEIRRWRFPKPVGGSVQVRYPFVFRVQGF